jgi:hypothetical protein
MCEKRTCSQGRRGIIPLWPKPYKKKKTRSGLASLNPNQSAGRRPLSRPSARAERRGHEQPAPPSRRAAPPPCLCRSPARPPSARPASARRPEQLRASGLRPSSARARTEPLRASAAQVLRPSSVVRSGSDRAAPRLRRAVRLSAERPTAREGE